MNLIETATFKPLDREFSGLDQRTTLHPLSDRMLAIQTATLHRSDPIPQTIHFLDLENPQRTPPPWQNPNHCQYLNHRGSRAYFGASGSLHCIDINSGQVEKHPCTSATILNCCDLSGGRTATISKEHLRFWSRAGTHLQAISYPRAMTVQGGGQTDNGFVYVWTVEEGKAHLRLCSKRSQGEDHSNEELLYEPRHTAPLHSFFVFARPAILSLTKTDDHKLTCEALRSNKDGYLEPVWRQPVVLDEDESIPLSVSMGSIQSFAKTAEWAGENGDLVAFRIEEKGQQGRFLTLRKSDGKLSELRYNADAVTQPTLVGDRVVGIVATKGTYQIGELTAPPPTPPGFFTKRRAVLAMALLILAYTVIRVLRRRTPSGPTLSPGVRKPDLSAPPGQWYVFPSKRPDPGLPWTHPLNRDWI